MHLTASAALTTGNLTTIGEGYHYVPKKYPNVEYLGGVPELKGGDITTELSLIHLTESHWQPHKSYL